MRQSRSVFDTGCVCPGRWGAVGTDLHDGTTSRVRSEVNAATHEQVQQLEQLNAELQAALEYLRRVHADTIASLDSILNLLKAVR